MPGTRTAPTFYIEVDTYWQNSKSFFVGPFVTRAAAEAWIEQPVSDPTPNVWLSTSLCGGDIRAAWRVYPKALGATEAKRHGMRTEISEAGYCNVIAPTTEPTAAALAAAAADLREWY